MSYSLRTNNKPHPLVSFFDLPKRARADFDYVDEDDHYSERFVMYRGQWYDTHDTQQIEPDSGRVHRMGWAMRVHPGEPLARFDAWIGDSYFSGVAFRFVDDGDAVVCATIIS